MNSNEQASFMTSHEHSDGIGDDGSGGLARERPADDKVDERPSPHEPKRTSYRDTRSDGRPFQRKAQDQPEDRSPPTQSRTCGCSKTRGRNLVVCIDGTSNQFGEKNTNVIELYSLIQKGEDDGQLTWYNSGIGTYARPSWKSLSWYKQVIGHKIDLAIAWNFENIVLDAYRWLSETYKDGDCIFLFGFSRGAYQVRTLSAMIEKVGLIHRGNEKQIPFAYQWYADPDADSLGGPSSKGSVSPPPSLVKSPEPSPSSQKLPPSPIKTAKRFKQVFSRDVKVHFVGAWDTVSSIGIVRGRKLLPNTIDGMKHVCYFRHALALDERRVKFLPEYAYGGVSQVQTQAEDSSHTKEVWFAGTHSDIGGGNVENQGLDLTRPSLRWMYSEASTAGLRLNRLELNYKDAQKIDFHESLTLTWLPLEIFPFRRLTYRPSAKRTSTTYRPHLGGARIVQEGQKIHQSVWGSEGLGTEYTPCALPPQATFKWRELRKTASYESSDPAYDFWRETDLYDAVKTCIGRYTDYDLVDPDNVSQQNQLEAIRAHAHSAESRRALIRELGDRLRNANHIVRADILRNVLDILETSTVTRSRVKVDLPYRLIRSHMAPHLSGADEEQRKIAYSVLDKCASITIAILNSAPESLPESQQKAPQW